MSVKMIYFQRVYDKPDRARLSSTLATFYLLANSVFLVYALEGKKMGYSSSAKDILLCESLLSNLHPVTKQGKGGSSSCALKNSPKHEWTRLRHETGREWIFGELVSLLCLDSAAVSLQELISKSVSLLKSVNTDLWIQRYFTLLCIWFTQEMREAQARS